MKTDIAKRILKLEGLIEAEGRRRAPGIAELLRERYAAVRANQGLPLAALREATRGLSIAEILHSRYSRLQPKAES